VSNREVVKLEGCLNQQPKETFRWRGGEVPSAAHVFRTPGAHSLVHFRSAEKAFSAATRNLPGIATLCLNLTTRWDIADKPI